MLPTEAILDEEHDVTDPVLRRITVYPIKSLDGVAVTSCECLANGALQFDRRFAIQTADGHFLNAKRTTDIHRLRAEFDLVANTVRLGDRSLDSSEEFSQATEFPLAIECEPLDRFLSGFFDQTVTLVENDQGGFPDDPAACGPTIISQATLQTVSGWFEGLTAGDARRRFRANLEVGGVAPFWEDRLLTSDGGFVFQIGAAGFLAVQPCQRCVVPTRSADTGEVTPRFIDEFCRQRERTLPDGVPISRFDHYYRLAVNTVRPTEVAGRLLTTGDLISVQSDDSPRLDVDDAS